MYSANPQLDLMQPWAGMGYHDKGIKALGQSVTPESEFSERAKVPLESAYLFDVEGLDGKQPNST